MAYTEGVSDLPHIDLTCLAARSDGWGDVWWQLWVVLEARMREIVLDGPANDPIACRVRPMFRGVLSDTTTADDFISDTLEKQTARAEQGTLLSDEHLAVDLGTVVRMLVSKNWVMNRARTYAQRTSAVGVSGMNRDVATVERLDVGEETPFGASVAAKAVTETGTSVLMEQLDRGVPCLRLALESTERLTSVEETAASHTLPLLSEEEATTGVAREVLDKRVDGGLAALTLAHTAAQRSIRSDEKRLVEEGLEHPGREQRAQVDLVRRLTKLRARRVVEPLEASQLQTLFGLPTLNAAEKRNSKYRRALEGLFPELHGEFQGMKERTE